jgi:4-amino-4-deoxy-L-arabinose transferase-like glycosyltransferase
MLERFSQGTIYGGLAAFTAAAFLAITIRVTPGHVATGIVAGLLWIAAVIWIAAKIRMPKAAVSPRRPKVILSAIVLAGILLRAGWVIAVPPHQTSDFVDYVGGAARLASSGVYGVVVANGNMWRAYRPPGYAAFLAAWFRLFGSGPLIPAIANILLYGFSCVLLYAIARRLAGTRAGLAAAALFSCWPSNIGMTGLAGYEPLFTLLLLTAMWAIVRAERESAIWGALAGAANGLAVLVRPTVLLLPAVWAVASIRQNRISVRRVLRIAAAAAMMAICILPWSLRNYKLLGRWVPVSTNGGIGLFIANNPEATVAYSEPELNDLLEAVNYDEARAEEVCYRRAKAWIREHPARFLQLAAGRVLLFVEDDGTGIYWSFKIGLGKAGRWYTACQGLAQLWWGLVWSLLLYTLIRERHDLSTPAVKLLAGMILLFVVTAVPFTTQPRYHMPMVPILLAFAVRSLVSPEARDKEGEATSNRYRYSVGQA